LTLLEAVQHQFDTAGNSQLFEDSEQVISHDLLLARGCTARQVALVCYAITGSLVVAGWFIIRLEIREALISSLLIGCALFAIEVRMGAMRSQDAPNKRRTQEDLEWRKMADHALHEKV
jgi:hypothetical protein